MRKPIIYLIAGCNGAGKTTFAAEFLPKEVKCLRFFNADEIARGLSPFNPSIVAMKAGRLLLNEVHNSVSRKETFALESTLSGRTYLKLLGTALVKGYEIEIHYLCLATPAQAVARVRQRVRMGGHNVPSADIRRRFTRSRAHFANDYLPLATRWTVWDSRSLPAKLLASSETHDMNLIRTFFKP